MRQKYTGLMLSAEVINLLSLRSNSLKQVVVERFLSQ
jgi:hypothetical protein